MKRHIALYLFKSNMFTMSSTEVFYALGDFFYATFELLESLGNLPNVLFIVIGFIAALTWILQMVKHQKESKA